MNLTRRSLLQGVSAFAVTPVLAATATGKIALTNTAWTDLGAGPLTLTFAGDGVYAIGDTVPALPFGEGFSIRSGKSVLVDTPSHVWASARGDMGANAYASPFIGGVGGATSVWSAADATANGMTLSNGGLTVTVPPAAWDSIRTSISRNSGKLYVEFAINSGNNLYVQMGVASAGFNVGNYLGSSNYSFGENTNAGSIFASAGFSGLASSTLVAAMGPGDVLGMAVDFTAGHVWLAVNNSWADSGNPSAGTNPTQSFILATVGSLFAALGFNTSSQTVWTLQASDASLKYRPPAGFQAWDGGPVTPSTSVWSAADASANGMTLSNGGLTAAATSGNHYTIRNTISKTSGKLYIEFLVVVGEPDDYGLWGVAASSFPITTYLGGAPTSAGIYNAGNTFVTTGFTANYVVTPAAVANDVIALAVDFGAGSIWIARNNVWLNSSNPATATLPIVSFVPATVGALFAGVSFGNSTWTLQSQPSQQKYLPPPGFQAWDGGPVTPNTSVWSAADASANGMTLSNGGLTVTPQAAVAWKSLRSSISQTSGKLYVEFLCAVAPSGANAVDQGFGLASSGFVASSYLGSSNYSFAIFIGPSALFSTGFTINYATTFAGTAVLGDVYALAVDFTAGKIWLSKNNVWDNSSNPATGSLPEVSFVPATVGALFAAMSLEGPGTGNWTLQATAASQKYAPPSGFTPWG